MDDGDFRQLVWDHYRRHGRQFSWRSDTSPYRVHVSELMLQQTQTQRVAPAFERFIQRFPDYRSLAEASLSDVIDVWQGLGYNRRARFLKQAAEILVRDHQSVLPADEARLKDLPGIGPNTAASILAFAFNLPTVFVETNIRTVFLHHYFPESQASDREILPLVARTVDQSHPREWYWALMDYGVHLKKTIGNVSRRSSHYLVQSRFTGSVRQVRGEILRVLLASRESGQTRAPADLQTETFEGLNKSIPHGPGDPGPESADRYQRALSGLIRDGMVMEREHGYCLPD